MFDVLTSLTSRRRRLSSSGSRVRAAPVTEPLEVRRLFTLGRDGLPEGPTFKYTNPPAGWHVDVQENRSGDVLTGASLTLTGPDTDDVVRVTRSPTLQTGVDLVINGRIMTINFVHADAPIGMSWDIHCGGGNDRVDILLGMGDAFAGPCVVYGDDGNDVLVNGDLPSAFYGGNGDDVLIGGAAADRLEGDAGIDQLFGRAGEDLLVTGSGASPILPGEQMVDPRETADGGPGFDRIYSSFSYVFEPPLVFPDPVATELPAPAATWSSPPTAKHATSTASPSRTSRSRPGR